MKKYYSLEQNGSEANINIYGDITSWAWEEYGEMSAVNLSKKLEELGEVSKINVYINSYGGEVAEGLAIYNALKRHKAKVVTYCDGFAASIASVIFMAGDERIMNEASLLMIHNAWTWAQGNAEELRKQADDLDKITQASVIAYKAHSTLSEEEIKALMDKETWILPSEAIEYGFATATEETENTVTSQNAKMSLLGIIKAYREEAEEEPETEEPETEDEEKPSDEEEESETDEETEEEAEDEEDETEKTNQRIFNFFNALINM